MEADYVGFGKAIESDLEWMAKGVGNQVELIESLLDKAAKFGLAEGRGFKEFGQVFVVSGRTKNETECHIVLVAANSTGQAAEFGGCPEFCVNGVWITVRSFGLRTG